jgi:hypothetical protein
VSVRTDGQSYEFAGGSTLIIDLTVPAVRHCVSQSVDNAATRKRTAEFLAEAQRDPLHALFSGRTRAAHSPHSTSSQARYTKKLEFAACRDRRQ